MTADPTQKRAWDRRALVEPPNLDARVDHGWARLTTAPARRARRPWLAAGAVTLTAAAAVLLLLWPAAEPARWVDRILETEAAPVVVRLADGSTVAAQPEATIRRVREDDSTVVLRMERGAATYDVRPNPQRAFVVWAGDVEVRVIGTRFVVSLEPAGAVQVEVERGGVDVRRGDDVQRVRAGERVRHEPRDVSAVPAQPPAPEAREEPTAAEEPPRPGPTAASLLTMATAARRDGRYHEAVQAYQRLVEAHPGDPRAPLAALELARLRMDVLHQPARAVTALRFAARRGGRSPTGEDALARLALAYEAAGRPADCRRARRAYLATFPRGSHRARVGALCPAE